MPQFDFGTINPDTTDGAELASWLNSWRDAVNSQHRGTLNPPYLIGGMIWVKQVSGTLWQILLYDGATNIPIGIINPSANTFALPPDAVVSSSIGSGQVTTAKMASQNISQWTNDSGYAPKGAANVFTQQQTINLGQAADAIALRLAYTTTGRPIGRFLQIKTPVDIAHPGGNPWQIDTPDSLDIKVDGTRRLSINESGNVEVNSDLNVVGDFTVGGQPLGSGVTVQVFNSSGTWTRPRGCTSILAILCGGGGGGGGADGTDSTGDRSGGGGGSAASIIEYVDVASVPSIPVTVGAGGVGGAVGGGNGSAGGSTSLGTYASAAGGGGGIGSTHTSGNSRENAGGSAGTVSTSGLIDMNGEDGERSGPAGNEFGGRGGMSFFGAGGRRRRPVATVDGNGAGYAATSPGAGGGGAATSDTIVGYTGGNGGVGLVLILEFA